MTDATLLSAILRCRPRRAWLIFGVALGLWNAPSGVAARAGVETADPPAVNSIQQRLRNVRDRFTAETDEGAATGKPASKFAQWFNWFNGFNNFPNFRNF